MVSTLKGKTKNFAPRRADPFWLGVAGGGGGEELKTAELLFLKVHPFSRALG